MTIMDVTIGGVTGSELVCPLCGGDNLHHARITTYSRVEEAEETSVTETNCDQRMDEGSAFTKLLPSDEIHNPSPRRDGMAIDFSCEHCHAAESHLQLVIYQHKGVTKIQWRSNGWTHGV